MFTGIVEELGEVVALTELTDAARLQIRATVVTSDAKHGDSIAVNGVCLTVVEHTADSFVADVMAETLNRSALADLRPGSPVNLERAVTLATRLGGHLVQGHVDGTGRIAGRRSEEHWDVVEISAPPQVLRYVVEKGSITVDGVSLTVATVGVESFTVSLIPTTLALTTLGRRQPGDAVNLEVDVLAKYVERLLGQAQ
ncbi:MAG: riboflavin synthase [Sporichthyaceae bacterium]